MCVHLNARKRNPETNTERDNKKRVEMFEMKSFNNILNLPIQYNIYLRIEI